MLNVKTISLMIGLAAISTSTMAKNKCDESVISVNTEQGSICGVTQEKYQQKSQAYLGVPFAQPPVGKLRWRAPQPIDSTEKDITFQATEVGNICVQQPGNGSSVYVGNEDCLNLNIWTPKGKNKNLPVMVFIPGGGYMVGAGGLEIYNGTYLAAKHDVVVITINYRLGSFGFLRYTGKDSQIEGNFGILDQLQALKWVQNNIAAFGGDPDKVTLFGESAGAMSVNLHLMSVPASNNLFRAGIMESNLHVPYATAEQANKLGTQFIDLLCKNDQQGQSCPKDINWLQSLSVDTIMKSQNQTLPGGIASLVQPAMAQGTVWSAIIGVDPITGQPTDGYHEGNDPKPYVFGFNQNEGVFFSPEPNKFTAEKFKNILVTDFGKDGYKKIINYTDSKGNKPYSPKSYTYNKDADMTPASQAMAAVMTHYAFSYGNLYESFQNWDKQQAAGKPMHGYYFTQESTFNYQNIERCAPDTHNICHTYELPYVFHNFVVRQPNGEQLPAKDVSKLEVSLSDKMNSSWAGFAKDPDNWKNGFGYPPMSSVKTGKYVHFEGDVSLMGNLLEVVNYSFWETIKPATKVWDHPLPNAKSNLETKSKYTEF